MSQTLEVEKIIYVQDIALYTAVGTTPWDLYVAIEAYHAERNWQSAVVSEVHKDCDELSRCQYLLENSILLLVRKYRVDHIYLQAPGHVYNLLLALVPQHAFHIIHTEIDLAAVTLPCLVVAVDSKIQQLAERGGEAAIALFLTEDMEQAKAKLTLTTMTAKEHSDSMASTRLHAFLGDVGKATNLCELAYSLGKLEFLLWATKNIQCLQVDEEDQDYSCIAVASPLD